MNSMKPFSQRGYTMIEALAAAAVVAIGASAAASLSASLTLQEEFARRVAVVRNYQENMAQVWQLGLSPNEVLAILPTAETNRNLTLALHGSASVLEQGPTVLAGPQAVTVETAICRAAVNISRAPQVQEAGSSHDLFVCRSTIR